MIRVLYIRRGSGHELTVSGHADFAERGKDIVCAGISALTQALLGWLDDHGENISEIVGPAVHSGHLWVRCSGNTRVTTAFQMAAKGYEQIAAAYPDHVEFQYSGTDR